MANSGQSKEVRDNRSRQLDPEHDAYWSSRGLSRPGAEPSRPLTEDERDNRSRQLDPEHHAYRMSRDG